jgi:hypothetical protein
MTWRWRPILVAGLLLSGCAGLSPAQIGQTAGTLAGGAIVPGIGAPVGALVGLLAGIIVQGHVDKVTERRERQTLGQELAGGPVANPSAPPPAGQLRVWIDETVRNGRLVPGHFDVRSDTHTS